MELVSWRIRFFLHKRKYVFFVFNFVNGRNNHKLFQAEIITNYFKHKLYSRMIYAARPHLSMALQPFVGLSPLFSFLIYTQSAGLLGRRISQSKNLYLYTEQHRHRISAHRHPCLEWDSNPRPQCSSGRRQFMS
jgi:hypothetical protein